MQFFHAILFFISIIHVTFSLNNFFRVVKMTTSSIISSAIPTWPELSSKAYETPYGRDWLLQETLRASGEGTPHTNAKLRLFGSNSEPRITFYRDTAAWCPYCQKLWILLEEKKIPYKLQKINMR